MRESNFVKELQDTLEAMGAWSYKIPDIPLSMIKGMKFNPMRPFDLAVCYRGRFIAIECKQIKTWRKFGRDDIRLSQYLNLAGVAKNGGTAYVALNVRTETENRLILFEWKEWNEKLRKGIGTKELKELNFFQGSKGIFPGFDFQVKA